MCAALAAAASLASKPERAPSVSPHHRKQSRPHPRPRCAHWTCKGPCRRGRSPRRRGWLGRGPRGGRKCGPCDAARAEAGAHPSTRASEPGLGLLARLAVLSARLCRAHMLHVERMGEQYVAQSIEIETAINYGAVESLLSEQACTDACSRVQYSVFSWTSSKLHCMCACLQRRRRRRCSL